MTILRNDPDDPESISDNYIRALAFGHDGTLWIGTDGGGLNRFDPATAKAQRIRRTAAEPTSSLPDDRVYSLAVGGSGELWVGTAKGLAVSRPGRQGFEMVALPGTAGGEPIRSLHLAPGGRLWIATETAGAFAIDTQGGSPGTVVHLPVQAEGVNDVLETNPGTVWLATRSNGLIRVDSPYDAPVIGAVWQPAGGQDAAPIPINAVRADESGRLWIATDGAGLYGFDPASGRTVRYRNSPGDAGSLINDTVVSLLLDEDGTVWAGTLWFGVSRTAAQPPILHFSSDPLISPGLPHMAVLAFAEETATGRVWVGTAAGLALLDPGSGRFLDYAKPFGLAGTALAGAIRALAIQDATLWIGTSNGLVSWNRDTGIAAVHRHDPSDPASLSSDRVRLLRVGRDGRLWVGTVDGLNRLDPATGTVERFLHDPRDPGSLPNNQIRGLREGRDGELWVGTAAGLSRREPDGRFTTWRAGSDKRTSLADDNVRDIHQTADGALWLATGNGLTRFDPAAGRMATLDGRDGFPNTTLYGILSDDAGRLWISSNGGLSVLHPQEAGKPVVFTSEDGLQDNEFNFGAFLRLSDGRMLFGGVRGFNLFHPDELLKPSTQRIRLTVEQVRVVHDGVGRPATVPVTVDGDGEALEIEFLGIDYFAPQSVRYSYRLDGWDVEWSPWDRDVRKVLYGSLPPGSYLFRARAASGRGIPARAEIALPVSVRPALRQQGWFISACAILIAAITAGLLHAAHRTKLAASRRREHALQIRIDERTAELKRVLEERVRLYRHLSHQLRSPLTVISSVLQSAEGERQGDLVPLALSNAKRLERLIDDLLNLARPDDSPDSPEPPVLDISTVARWLVPSYRIVAAAQDLSFEAETETGATVRIPTGVVQCILDGLVENAIKYTDPGGRVVLTVTTAADQVRIEVSDTGIGIPQEEIHLIFEEFKRGEQSAVRRRTGVGLGLPMVKMEAERHGGRIAVASRVGAGSTFTVVLPRAPAAEGGRDPDTAAIDPASFPLRTPAAASVALSPLDPGQARPRLLIVEDEDDLAKLIISLFAAECDCVRACSVQDGLKAAESQPQAIICDLMLPDGSGLEIVGRLKTDRNLAHIPIVILTALRDEGNLIVGLSHRADDYIVKPFNNDELRLRVFSQIRNRQTTFLYFRDSMVHRDEARECGEFIHSLFSRGRITRAEKSFLTDFRAAILPDPSGPVGRRDKAVTTIDGIAEILKCSDNQLRYDIQLLSKNTGLTWMNFKNLVTIITMEYVFERIDSGDPIKIISYAIDLTPSSFSIKFRKIFGMTPTQWKQQSREKTMEVDWSRYFEDADTILEHGNTDY